MDRTPLLLISGKEEDVVFWQRVASTNSLPFKRESDPEKVGGFLNSYPSCLVFWDANPSDDCQKIEEVLTKHSSPARVFALTDEPINRHPDLQQPPAFGHHIFRRYDAPAPFLYSRLIAAGMTPDPSGLARYFPEGTQIQEFELSNSTQKKDALEMIERFMTDSGVNPKLISIGVDASDELLMNAVFDAPCDAQKQYYRRELSRAASFDLKGRERVEVRMAVCEDFVGISVTDHFGSLKRESILKHLCQNYRALEYTPPTEDLGAGLGLHRINQLALALLFVSMPGKKTEVMVFFSNSKSYRDFRLGFCFFSIFSG